MFNFARLLTLFLLVVITTTHSTYAEKTNNLKDKSTKVQFPSRLEDLTGKKVKFSINSAFIAIDDELSMLYSDKSGIVFQKGQKKTVITSDDGQTQRFWLQYDGKYLYALWWRKFTPKGDGKLVKRKGKQLTVSVSEDQGATFGEPVVISSDFGVLPTVSVASESDGRVVVSYHDERNSDFQVHMNYSVDGGKSWQKKDIRVDQEIQKSIVTKDSTNYRSSAIQPKVYLIGKSKSLFIWQQADNADGVNGLKINSRVFNFTDKTFSNVNTLYEPDSTNSLTYNSIQYKDNILVLLDVKGKGVVGILSNDEAVSWKNIGSNYAKDEFVADANTDGFINAVGSGDNIFVLNPFLATKDARGKIDLSVISLKEKKWSKTASTFDSGKDHNKTRSTYPIINSIGDKTIIAVWNDYRHLLSTVYMDVSQDLGEKWQKKPKPLTEPGFQNFELKKLVTGDKKAWVISTALTPRGTKAVDTWYYQEATLDDNKLSDFSASPAVGMPTLSLDDKKKRLEKRAKEFWEFRKASNWEASWDYFDPLYRVKFGKSNWLKTQGKVLFGDFELDLVEVDDGNVGGVSGKIELSTAQQNYEEGLVEASPFKTQASQTKWGWFYDDWYLMPDLFFLKVHEY